MAAYLHHVTDIRSAVFQIPYRNIYFPISGLNDASVKIQEIVKFVALDGEAVVLNTAGQRLAVNGDLRIVDVQHL